MKSCQNIFHHCLFPTCKFFRTSIGVIFGSNCHDYCVFCPSAEDTEAQEGALQAGLHDLSAGSETEGLDDLLHWDGRWAAHKGVFRKTTPVPVGGMYSYRKVGG